MRYLTFELYGPLVSWGGIAVGQERASETFPTRSAVIGLLAAALGLDRDDTRQSNLAEDFGLAVRVEARGVPIRDFHTSQVPPASAMKGFARHNRRQELQAGSLNTILSSREYQCDALYQIALWPRDEMLFTLQALKAALEEPRFLLYLGRKSCPVSLPMCPKILEAVSLSECFEQNAATSMNFFKELAKNNNELFSESALNYDGVIDHYWDADGEPGSMECQMIFQQRDQPIDRQKWQFSERAVHYARLKRSVSAEDE